jgi:hypothetical protein
MYSMCLTKDKNATLGNTFAMVGKTISTPCKVEIAPIIQKTIIGIVKGVLRLIFSLIRRKNQEISTKNTKKSSALI